MADAHTERTLPPLEWLRVFEAAGRCGSFTAAAGELGLTQAAISQRIRNLEHRLGKELFVRKPRGVALTLDGEAYLPHVQAALSALSRSTADLFSPDISEITICAMPSHIELLILPRLKALLADRPQLRVTFVSAFRQHDFDNIAADFHLRYGNGTWPGRRAQLLHRERLAPAVAPQHLKQGGDWRALPALALSGPRSGWQAWAAATGSPPPYRTGMRFDSYDLALTAAIEGHGAILASIPLSQAAIGEGRLALLSEPSVTMDAGYWLSWAADRPVPALLREMVDILAADAV
ncbi:LysR family transcriptional regulator [Nitratireductor sp. XY-223]|uniref:LysR family transcriptional regulator n=1 Tax=Nitratireductor sp. XY-223 TaxID=2561926 RepID=UPI00145A4229|nr:LysR family transcriptional regulator [Nitratireductor sp. XY-223]